MEARKAPWKEQAMISEASKHPLGISDVEVRSGCSQGLVS